MNKEYWGYFLSAIGTISSIVTLISFVFQFTNPSCCVIIAYVVGILLVSYIYAEWQTCRMEKLSLKFSNTLNVNVFSGDLFDFAKDSSYVVIPVNEYFDTIVDDQVIHSGSVHGQFVKKYYGDNHEQLREDIEAYFRQEGITGKDVERPNSKGYTTKYPLGTCAVIKKDNSNFVLLALTHFDKDDVANVELSEFGRSVSNLCHHLGSRTGEKAVYMPLMGMGLSRLNQTAQFMMKYTLDTILGIKDLAILGGLNIVVYPPIARTLNLNEINSNYINLKDV